MKIKAKTIENDLEYLRQISKEVDFNSDEYKETLEKLQYYLENSSTAFALAPVQIGYPLRMIYLKKTDVNRLEEDYNESKVLINPVVIKKEGLTKFWEGCESCLNFLGLVERPYKIVIEYYDQSQRKRQETFEGFAATVLSHEMDHLDGILHIDKALDTVEKDFDERRKFRKEHPYEVIRKDGKFESSKLYQK